MHEGWNFNSYENFAWKIVHINPFSNGFPRTMNILMVFVSGYYGIDCDFTKRRLDGVQTNHISNNVYSRYLHCSFVCALILLVTRSGGGQSCLLAIWLVVLFSGSPRHSSLHRGNYRSLLDAEGLLAISVTVALRVSEPTSTSFRFERTFGIHSWAVGILN